VPARVPPSRPGPADRLGGVDDVELLTRTSAQVLPAGGLQAKLREGRPLRVKLGIDPSGSELTLGHAVVLRALRRFQDLGHTAVLIIGDVTGQVGDPTGRSQVRGVLSAEETAANSASYVAQVLSLLREDRLEVRRNSEWLGPMTFPEVLREARELTVARLLERDDFAKRHAAGQSISLVEFLYPLLQGYDSVAVRADVELGGTDQTYNLLVGRDLQRAHGQPEQVVLTVPLLVGLDGEHKMSKSLGNYVAISDPPQEMFGRLMRLSRDDLVGSYARLCTDLPATDCDRLEAAGRAGGPEAGQAKREMARAVVTLYHGAPVAGAAEDHFDTVFRDHEVPVDLPEHTVGVTSEPVHLPALLVDLGFAASRTRARALLDQRAVRLDGEVVTAHDVWAADLADRVLAAGRRQQARLRAPVHPPGGGTA